MCFFSSLQIGLVSWGFSAGCPAANNTAFPNDPVKGFGVLTNIQTFYSYIISILGDSVLVFKKRVGGSVARACTDAVPFGSRTSLIAVDSVGHWTPMFWVMIA
jgi:hypothetical protein